MTLQCLNVVFQMIAKLGVILILMDIDCSSFSAADSGTVCSSKELGSHAPWDAGGVAAIVRSTSCCVCGQHAPVMSRGFLDRA